jgi:hypothetical protein
MAVGIRIKLPGVHVEEFERLDAAIDIRGNHPDGLIFSASGCGVRGTTERVAPSN